MKKEKIIEWLKSEHYDEDLPWTFTAEKMADMLFWLWVDFYLETLGTYAGEWEQTLYLSYYEPIVNAVILMDDQHREYEFKTLEEIAEQIIERENLYDRFRQKFLPLKK